MVHTVYTNSVPMVPIRNMVLRGYLGLMNVATLVPATRPQQVQRVIDADNVQDFACIEAEEGVAAPLGEKTNESSQGKALSHRSVAEHVTPNKGVLGPLPFFRQGTPI